MTTSKNAWDLPSFKAPERKSRLFDFSFKNAMVLLLALPLLVVTACHHSMPDGSATFGKLVMAANVDANNAPTALADTFSPTQKTIYLVAEARDVAAGTRLAASWTRDGTPVQVSDDIVTSQPYHNSNIEFHLNAGTDGFTPGSYKVQLIVNGQPGPSASFSVK